MAVSREGSDLPHLVMVTPLTQCKLFSHFCQATHPPKIYWWFCCFHLLSCMRRLVMWVVVSEQTENPLKGLAFWPRNLILQIGAFSSICSSQISERNEHREASVRDGEGIQHLQVRLNSWATRPTSHRNQAKRYLDFHWVINYTLFPSLGLQSIKVCFQSCHGPSPPSGIVLIYHCSQKKTPSQSSLRYFHAISVKPPQDPRSCYFSWRIMVAGGGAIPLGASHPQLLAARRSSLQVRKWTRRCRVPQTSAS